MALFPTRTKARHHLSSFKSDPSGWVELYVDPDVSEIEKVYKNETTNSFTKGLILLCSLITEWGFTQLDGETPAPVTLENVKKLGIVNISELLDLVNMPDTAKSQIDPKASTS